MLIAFSCSNFASFKDQVTLSMEATVKNEYTDFNTIKTEQGTYLKGAFVYGANGSGKSNLLMGIQFMKKMVLFSIHDDKLSRKSDPFKFLHGRNEQPSSFEMVLLLDRVVWTYGFELVKGKVVNEWLKKKQQRESTVFNRSGPEWQSIQLKGEWKRFDHLREHTRENGLFLSLAAMFNVEAAGRIREWFDDLLIYTHKDTISPGFTVKLLEEKPELKNDILNFLQQADFGIEDFEMSIEEDEVTDQDRIDFMNESNLALPLEKVNIRKATLEVNTRHKVYNMNNEPIGTIPLSFTQYQSTGTVKFFELLGPVLLTLLSGGTLIIDEIDSRLHPLLVRHLVSYFHSLDRNPHNAQLICNTHDVLLLEEPIRRDQIWFMQKDAQGASELYSLAEFTKVRKNDPILKKYLLGIFGAVPFQGLSQVEVNHAQQ